MSAMNKMRITGLLAGMFLACAFLQTAGAAEVAGVKFPDTAKVGGKELLLNGLGVRTKFIVKVYAAGLYLQQKESTVDEVLKADGPRRMQLIMMRDITSDDFGNAFMSGLNNNVDNKDKSKIVTQISKFGEMFAQIDALKKGDVLDLDYIPGTGTQCYLNGKRVGETAPDLVFYNSILRIWLGDKPADNTLKTKLLAPAAAAPAPAKK
ncbi:chalcone isomerase family protein [Massilia sp. CF038]|uniref:chalcone isomerase family protein n=1 Tax=Massilia sp. CF038 TaxID=1881045 RepID=UPI0009235FFA|nr:chalcone isomerase family protein [Massilia sp. CF038]SHH44821.1 Chalcone isomerase-like [Massilia sp. CF038]